MPGPSYVADSSFQCGGAIAQFTAVKMGADTNHVVAAVADNMAIGVAQAVASAAEATAGKAIPVRMMGITRMVAGDAVTMGAAVKVDASGRAIPLAAATPNQNQIGIAQKAATAAGQIIFVLLTPGVARTTT